MIDQFENTYKDLFRQYYSSLLFYATRLVGEEDAEDLVQDVFVEIWKRQKRLEYYQPDQSETIRRIENKELRTEIKEAINELPDKCKEIFKLSYLHDMKNKDIADVMGISLRTVEAHMYKALKILRKKLEHLR